MLKKIHISTEKLKCLSFENSLKLINKSNNFNCITLMGVLEHISQLSKFMKTLKNNKKIKIIYLVVPLFSLTAVIESVFPKIFNRHLGGSHTHLFTENSLKYLFKKNGFHPHSEWWFGQDFNDLARSIIADMVRIAIQQSITLPLTNFIKGIFGNANGALIVQYLRPIQAHRDVC